MLILFFIFHGPQLLEWLKLFPLSVFSRFKNYIYKYSCFYSHNNTKDWNELHSPLKPTPKTSNFSCYVLFGCIRGRLLSDLDFVGLRNTNTCKLR